MRVVKLGSRYILAQHGFTHGLRFEHRCQESDAIKKALWKLHPNSEPWNRWAKWKNKTAPWGYYQDPARRSTPYWIGVRNESDLTAAILMAKVDDV